jgi:hypothetical protein
MYYHLKGAVSDASSSSCGQDRKLLGFIKPEGSLPCSQRPTAGPIPELINYSPKIYFIYLFHVCLGVPRGLSSLDLPNKITH